MNIRDEFLISLLEVFTSDPLLIRGRTLLEQVFHENKRKLKMDYIK